MTNRRDEAIDRIKSNIESSGFHVYQILPDATPGYFYTIGLTETLGAEIVLAGGAYYPQDQLALLFQKLAKQFLRDRDCEIDLGTEGEFVLHEMDSSWSTMLLSGATDYYSADEVHALQVMPEDEKMTLDVPDMTERYEPESAGGWKWLTESWPYQVNRNSTAVTHLDALLGYPITEATRWEETQWELFSGPGPDVDRSDIRIVPLALLVAEDPTLENVFELRLEEGLWRDDRDSQWNKWT